LAAPVNKLSGPDKRVKSAFHKVHPSAPGFLSYRPVRRWGARMPPHTFQLIARCTVMQKSRNEFRELAFVAVLLSLLIISFL
jgi:hypothetical protein